MDDLELKLCDIQGRLFELSVDSNISSEGFIKYFMNSDAAKHLDSNFNKLQWMGEEYIFDEVMSDFREVKGEVFDKDIIFWIGYIYRYWHYMTGESSKKILRTAPVKTMKRNYKMFHTMAPELAIENLIEINHGL